MRSRLSVFVLGALLSAPLGARAAVIDFETLTDLEAVTNQYAGLTFSNTIAFVSGAIGGSLNEIDFPTHSGDVVVVDDGGPISIAFSTPVGAVGGFFTYTNSLTLEAFDTLNVSLGSASSLFSSNVATGGDPGSSPNEFIQFASALGIASVRMTGIAGFSFTLDDLTITPLQDPDPDPVPEPGTLVLLSLAGSHALRRARRTRR